MKRHSLKSRSMKPHSEKKEKASARAVVRHLDTDIAHEKRDISHHKSDIHRDKSLLKQIHGMLKDHHSKKKK